MSRRLYESTLGTAATRSAPRPTFRARFRRLLVRLAMGHSVFMATSLGLAAYTEEAHFRLEHNNAIVQDVQPKSTASTFASVLGLGGRRTRGGDFPRHLLAEELECVQAIKSLWEFDVRRRVMEKVTPKVEFADPWFTLRGSLELQDAWVFASRLCESADPAVTKVARCSTDRNVLFLDMSTAYTLRGLGLKFELPSTVKIRLQADHKGRRRIRNVEHRWFGNGPIAGTLSYSDNFVARSADGLRHMNGFIMSVAMSTEHLAKHYLATHYSSS